MRHVHSLLLFDADVVLFAVLIMFIMMMQFHLKVITTQACDGCSVASNDCSLPIVYRVIGSCWPELDKEVPIPCVSLAIWIDVQFVPHVFDLPFGALGSCLGQCGSQSTCMPHQIVRACALTCGGLILRNTTRQTSCNLPLPCKAMVSFVRLKTGCHALPNVIGVRDGTPRSQNLCFMAVSVFR